MIRAVLGVVFVIGCLNAQNQLVPIAKKNISWKSKVSRDDLFLVEASKKYRCKDYIDTTLLEIKTYKAKHYIPKGRVVCKKDIYEYTPKKVRFVFGSLIIEKEGEVVNETKNYVKIRNSEGKIEKIYKNGDMQ